MTSKVSKMEKEVKIRFSRVCQGVVKCEKVKDLEKTETTLHQHSEKEQSDGLNNIIAAAASAKLSTTKLAPKIVGCSKDSIGSVAAKVSTIVRYEDVWRGVQQFCIGIGDYISGIIVTPEITPVDPFPVSLETAVSFIRYKVQVKGKVLLHPSTNQPMMWLTGSREGQKITCTGSWTSATTVYISVLHFRSFTKTIPLLAVNISTLVMIVFHVQITVVLYIVVTPKFVYKETFVPIRS